MTDQIEQELEMLLANSGMVEPVSIKKRGRKASCLCRGVPSEVSRWLEFVKQLLLWAEENQQTDSVFVGKQYLLKSGNVAFGWLLEFDFNSAKELKAFMAGFLSPTLRFHKKPGAQRPAQIQPQQAGKKPNIVKVISRHVDDKGRVNEVVEVPLAHVPKDLNVPTKPVWSETHGRMIGGGRGATSTTAK